MKIVKRTIEIQVFEDDDKPEFGPGFDPNCKEQSRAIGHLVGWSLMAENKPEVTISIHSNGCMYADYYLPDANGKREHKYQIYAMKDLTSGEYSFHS